MVPIILLILAVLGIDLQGNRHTHRSRRRGSGRRESALAAANRNLNRWRVIAGASPFRPRTSPASS